MFQTRDIKSGKGERKLFYDIFECLAVKLPHTCEAMLDLIPKHGYYKDLCNMYIMWGGKPGVFQVLRQKIVGMFVTRLATDFGKCSAFLKARQEAKAKIKLAPITLVGKWI